MNFKELVKDGAGKFKDISKVKILSHHDSDGISSAGIMIKLLDMINVKYSLSVLPFLDRDAIEQISKEKYDNFIFTDFGSGTLDEINELMKDKKIFILDHHKPKDNRERENIIQVNPHLAGVDGSKEISGSGVTYFFCREIDERIKNMAHIAIIGAIGDMQEKNGFLELNSEILDDAVSANKIKLDKGIRIFGSQTRILNKLLEYCSEPNIEGVSGNEKGAKEFLTKLGIDGSKRLSELNSSEREMLMNELVKKTGEKIIGNNYIIIEEKLNQLKEAREFSTVLNACGRMGKSSLGVGACLGDKEMKTKAVECLSEYRGEIVKTMDWFNSNRNTGNVIEKKGFVIVNAKDKVRGSVIGTLGSLLSKSNTFSKGTFVLTVARLEGNKSKASLRVVKESEIDLRLILKEIIEILGEGDFGGHKNAAGALFSTVKEAEFIKISNEILENKSMEEGIL